MTAHYVYRCYNAEGRLIYVGMAANVFGRLTVHRDYEKTWWLPQVVKVRARVCKDVATARQVELAAIRAENPRWNVWGRWGGRRTWTRQDYLDYAEALRHTYAGMHSGNEMLLNRTFKAYRKAFGEEPPTQIASRASA